MTIEDRNVTFDGEWHDALGTHRPDFVLAARALRTWDDGSPLSPQDRIRVLRALMDAPSRGRWIAFSLPLEEAAQVSGALDADYPLPSCDDHELSAMLVTEPDAAVFWCGRSDGRSAARAADELARSSGGTTFTELRAERGIALPDFRPFDPASIKAWTSA